MANVSKRHPVIAVTMGETALRSAPAIMRKPAVPHVFSPAFMRQVTPAPLRGPPSQASFSGERSKKDD